MALKVARIIESLHRLKRFKNHLGHKFEFTTTYHVTRIAVELLLPGGSFLKVTYLYIGPRPSGSRISILFLFCSVEHCWFWSASLFLFWDCWMHVIDEFDASSDSSITSTSESTTTGSSSLSGTSGCSTLIPVPLMGCTYLAVWLTRIESQFHKTSFDFHLTKSEAQISVWI